MSKKKAQYAINKLCFTFSLAGIFFFIISTTAFKEGSTGLGIGMAFFGALFFIIPLCLMPLYYRFDSDGVSLKYLFLTEERYLWKNVWSIHLTDDSTRTSIFNIFFMVFQINGQVEGKHRRYMEGKIQKSIRTKHLIEKYWDGEVEGYLIDDIKDHINRCKAKKAMGSQKYSSESVARAERVVRKETQEQIRPYISRFAMIDLELRCNFVYVTDDLEELNSRPKKKYKYTVSVEISRKGETNEDMILCVDAALLTVKLGKDEYVSTKRKGAYRGLTEELDTLLEEIEKTGFEAYCKGEVQ